MRNHLSTRALLFFFLGLSLTSCIGKVELAPFNQTSQVKTVTTSVFEAPTQTRAALDTLAGERYLVATFPSGAKIFLVSPQEKDVFITPWADVVGMAPAETVITLNDEISVAGPDGYFFARVPLEEGLNEIQGVGSDLDGNEVSFSYLVVYEPEG
jgi:hypothetical protein